jgi:hypothetical protein
MFRTLAPFAPTEAEISALADSMGDAPGAPDPAGDNPDIPSGYTYLGQFVDHDITFDPVSNLDRLNDPDALHTFRTPRFDLDSLYGSGRTVSPHLYDQDDPFKLLVGRNSDPIQEPVDLPRNQQGRALLGDPRNDVTVIVGQLHLVFIRFHNAVVDHLRMQFFPEEELFDEACRLVRWHYQWVVVHDHLRRVAGGDVVDEVLVVHPETGASEARLRFYKWRAQPFMPVEFSVAAYRYGHSMVRPGYRLNDTIPRAGEGDTVPILTDILVPNPLQHLGGFRALPKDWTIDWRYFFAVDAAHHPQPSRRIDTRISEPMRHLPVVDDDQRRSIALLNLRRGVALQLPSGQAVAGAMGTAVPDATLGLTGEAPLWYYLLKEAEVQAEGRRLGPTGARIVAEVLVGLLVADPSSFLRTAPAWRPELPGATAGDFTMVDLLQFAASG